MQKREHMTSQLQIQLERDALKVTLSTVPLHGYQGYCRAARHPKRARNHSICRRYDIIDCTCHV